MGTQTQTRDQVLSANAKTIREALRNNCWHVYHVTDDGKRHRVVDVRTRKGGQVQVRHMSCGEWQNVTGVLIHA
jgi:hypothetical protein